ncbi:MAG: enoyl-CoA hydratase/isomerase family protein [Alphaproteobacteria bacterium]|nr:enoyl-CoA hydratase/isomerase family protein [Alphaproteobacteria bacterium]
MPGEVVLSKAGAIATVALSAPERLNALDLAMWRQVAAHFRAIAKDDSVRCVILRGAGEQAFAAGADIAEFANERSNVQQARNYGGAMHGALDAILECPQPVLAAILGPCVGGGLELASTCDLRLCGVGSRFGVPVNRLGLVVAYNEMRPLVELVGKAVALEIVLEGRVFGAAEAKEKGLVNRVVPDGELLAEALATATRIAEGAPLVARWHKKFARRLADPRPLSAAEADESFHCFGTEDFQIGYRSFLEKRKPSFKGC